MKRAAAKVIPALKSVTLKGPAAATQAVKPAMPARFIPQRDFLPNNLLRSGSRSTLLDQMGSQLQVGSKLTAYRFNSTFATQATEQELNPPPHSGVSVKGVNFDASRSNPSLRTHLEEIGRAEDYPKIQKLLENYVETTLQNVNYASIGNLVQRAENFDKYLPAEKSILDAARHDMQNPESTLATQSAHMVHLARGLWGLAQLSSEQRQQLSDEIEAGGHTDSGANMLGPDKHERLYPETRELHAMFVREEHGPMTFKQSQYGADAIDFVIEAAELLAEVENNVFKEAEELRLADRVSTHRNGSHHLKSPNGVDLSEDPGTISRDAKGLPVMLGTSGTSADVANTVKFAADKLKTSPWAENLSGEEGRRALTDAMFYYMRVKAQNNAQSVFNRMRTGLGAEPKESSPDRALTVFIHSYPEISSAIDTVLDGGQESSRTHDLYSNRAAQRLDALLKKNTDQDQGK